MTARPRLLDQGRDALRVRHYSLRTEETYVQWIKRFIHFHGKRHPAEIGAPEVMAFLSDLAVRGCVAASTQNQALSALLYPDRHVLERDLAWLDGCDPGETAGAPSGGARPRGGCTSL